MAGQNAMSHTYTSIFLHIVFSTKDRRPYLDCDLSDRLKSYLGGLSRHLGAVALEINGAEDHLHLIVAAPAILSVSEFMQKLKGCSSKWVHEQYGKRGFAWQRGYGVFSVSRSNVDAVRDYIRRQDEHHAKHDFAEEFLTLLKAHGVEYDPRYVFG